MVRFNLFYFAIALTCSILTFSQVHQAQAQFTCSPNSSDSTVGIQPQQIPPGEANSPYNEIVNFFFPTDTVFQGTNVQVDSYKVLNITGFPSGYTYNCSQPNCTYNGGQHGCATITGNPTTQDTGTYNVSFYVKTFVTTPIGNQSQTDTINRQYQVNSNPSVCTPDPSLSDPGFYPENMPPAIAGESYEHVTQILFRQDTLAFDFDSFTIDNVSGLPANFTSQCDNPDCWYPGGGNGCIKFSGLPQQSQIGTYNVNLTVTGYYEIPVQGTQTGTRDISMQLEILNDYADTICDPTSQPISEGFHPNPWPNATAGEGYEEVISMKFPQDTSLGGQTKQFDSISIASISNLPPSFTYQCDNPNCTYPGGAKGCMQVLGSPTSSDIGTYNVTITYNWYAGAQSGTRTVQQNFEVQSKKIVCTPDPSISDPGFYPENMPPAIAGESYEHVTQMLFKEDTTLTIVPVPFDSFTIDNISGLPANFSSQCNNQDCTYPGGENGCIEFTGSPTASQKGTYSVNLSATGYYEDPLQGTQTVIRNIQMQLEILEDFADTICDPTSQPTTNGVHPNPWPDANVNESYEEVITTKFPEDTMIGGQNTQFDSFSIASINNLPSGFTYQCDNPNCTYPSGAKGCMLVTGTPNINDTGTYNVNINVNWFAQGQTGTRTIQSSIKVKAGIADTGDLSCTPDPTLNEPGFYPTDPPPGVAGQDYENVTHMLFQEDTTVSAPIGDVTIEFDSFVIDSITGLPANYISYCNEPRCSYPGGGRGCIIIKGQPTESQVGDYQIVASVTGYGSAAVIGEVSETREITFDYKVLSAISDTICDPSPDPVSEGFSPNPWPFGNANLNYEESFTVKFPADTTINGSTYDYDSFKLNSMNGLPPSYAYQCGAANCTFMPDNKNCIRVTGYPGLSDTGTYSITAKVTAFGEAPVNQTELTYEMQHTITIDSIPDNIEGSPSNMANIELYPNPTNDELTVALNSYFKGIMSIRIINSNGQIAMNKDVSINKGKQTLNVNTSNLKPGFYILELRNQDERLRRKLLIK